MSRWTWLLILVLLLYAFTFPRWLVKATDMAHIQLTYVMWGDTSELEMNKRWIADFEDLHPESKINMVATDGSGTDVKIMTMVSGGTAPDVMYVWPDIFPKFVSEGLYMPLDDYLEKHNLGRERWFAELLEPYTHEGKLYGLPRSWHPYLLYYNQDLFDSVGVTNPEANWTWDDVIRVGKELTRDTDGDGRTDQYAIAGVPWETFVWGCGGEIFDKEGNCLLDTPEAITGLTLYYDLIYTHHIMPTPQELKESKDAQSLFMTGKVAMFALGIWCVPDFRGIRNFDWDIQVMPAGPKLQVTPLVTAGWATYAKTPHPEEALAFTTYLAGPEAQSYQMRIWRDPSGLKDVFNKLLFFEPEKAPLNRQALLDSIPMGRFRNVFMGMDEVQRTLNEELDVIFNGYVKRDEIPATVEKIVRATNAVQSQVAD